MSMGFSHVTTIKADLARHVAAIGDIQLHLLVLLALVLRAGHLFVLQSCCMVIRKI